jgi:hypothetical protein
MVTSKRVFGAAIVAVCFALAYQFVAVGQPVLQRTRQIGEQARQTSGRQPLRAVRQRSEANTPQIDTQTGTFQLRRQIHAGPPRRSLSRVASQWRLGVWTENAPKGLRVREVSRYSPAWRYGVEEGDYLLDIMGYPVGLYDGIYYPLAETLNEVTPPDGWVNLLIWNKRTLAEEELWIQAEPRTGFPVGEPSE